MATASQAAFCPKCGHELPLARAEKCPTCSTPLTPPDNSFFGSPDYLWHQREMHLDGCDTTRVTAKTKVHDLKKIEEIELALTDWARRCPSEDKMAALRDAQLILSNIVHAPVSPDELRQITSLGTAIGKLAHAAEEFFRHGGQVYDRRIGKIQALPGDNDGSNEATR